MYVIQAYIQAIQKMTELYSDKELFIFDGNCLVHDIEKINSQFGFKDMEIIMIDSKPEIFKSRLSSRGDNFVIVEKETRERLENLDYASKNNISVINTDNMIFETPLNEVNILLEEIINLVKD